MGMLLRYLIIAFLLRGLIFLDEGFTKLTMVENAILMVLSMFLALLDWLTDDKN